MNSTLQTIIDAVSKLLKREEGTAKKKRRKPSAVVAAEKAADKAAAADRAARERKAAARKAAKEKKAAAERKAAVAKKTAAQKKAAAEKKAVAAEKKAAAVEEGGFEGPEAVRLRKERRQVEERTVRRAAIGERPPNGRRSLPRASTPSRASRCPSRDRTVSGVLRGDPRFSCP